MVGEIRDDHYLEPGGASSYEPTSACPPAEYEAGSFEGPEKLLEIWFAPSAAETVRSRNSTFSSDSEGDEPFCGGIHAAHRATLDVEGQSRQGLRKVDRCVWSEMLAIVRCQVLNVVKNEHLDAYLLSESSFFVYPHKLILKTCGTTTLLHAVPRILEIALEYCGFERAWRVFYSRKSFMFPERQLDPHRDWGKEVECLDTYFTNGAAYTVGRANSGDPWYLYIATPGEDDSQEMVPQVPDEHDQTIEILMTHLDPEAMIPFYQRPGEEGGTTGGRRVDQDTGLDTLYPKALVDSFLFTPCGYSANALLKQGYYTIHVTPEPACSYASFETNIPTGGKPSVVQALIREVTRVFRPGKFSVTAFSSHPPGDASEEAWERHDRERARMARSLDTITGYKRTERIVYEFNGYDLVFGQFERRP
ncbi:uncharacterized protein VTP21DRAFT_5676 [Calcarisporiella thermophila]|uniref:uncharacterized protein n=1 Tax=Calcarisporiella thermophila TaxID=911321 RepID=UPI003743158E